LELLQELFLKILYFILKQRAGTVIDYGTAKEMAFGFLLIEGIHVQKESMCVLLARIFSVILLGIVMLS